MTNALLVGAVFGTVVGLAHAWSVYSRRMADGTRARAIYFAAWTLFLWVLFGSYVFYLWLVSVVLFAAYSIFKTTPNRSSSS